MADLVCVAFDDPTTADRARHLTTQAKVPGLGYVHDEVGYNYRLSNVLAGIGRGQLQVLPEPVYTPACEYY